MRARANRFRERVERKGAVLFDGAMGTELYRQGVFINRSYDDLCRTSPHLIREIHQSYRRAGAEVLETNSFGANRFQLQAHGLETEVSDINRAAARLAREVAGEELLVAGSVGPLGVRVEPFGPTSRAEAREAFAEQAAALAAGGADLLVLETFSDLAELEEAVRGSREACDLPLVALMTVQPDGATSYGVRPARIAEEGERLGVDAVGLNCSVGPALLLEGVREMALATRLPIAALPNAGLPREVQGRKMYLASPEYMASYARRLVEAGARMVGGCCGTRPEHIREMARELAALESREEGGRPSQVGRKESPGAEGEGREGAGGAGEKVSLEASGSDRPSADRAGAVRLQEGARPEAAPHAGEPVPFPDRSRWAARIARGESVTCVELTPPRGVDPEAFLEGGRRLAGADVDAVAIPDGPRASLRMGVVAAAVLLQRETGLEALAHVTCRDRNLLGMGTDLLGAQALGVRNLLLVTGDPPRMGPYPEATAVFDVDSIGLTNLVARLNRGEDLGGNPTGAATSFAIGVGVNPCAVDLEREMRRWYWKVEAGAEFAVTQPLFDPARLEVFLERAHKEGTRIPVVASLWPLSSLRDAEFLHHEVPGIEVPGDILRRMAGAGERGPSAARAEGLRIARQLREAVRGLCEGIQVVAPSGRVEDALAVLG